MEMSDSNSSDFGSGQHLSLGKPLKEKSVVGGELNKQSAMQTDSVAETGYDMSTMYINNKCNCNSDCFKQFKADDFSNILSGFKTFTDQESQNIFLRGQIEKHGVKRKHKSNMPGDSSKQSEIDNNSNSCSLPCKRNHYFKYFVTFRGRTVSVCKKAFISVYGISMNRVNKLCKSLGQNTTLKGSPGKTSVSNTILRDIYPEIHENTSSSSTSLSHCDISEKQNLGVGKRKRKKGVVRVPYQRQIIKKARLAGTEYINYKGNAVAARSTGEDCKCKYKCFEKFDNNDFANILHVFSCFKDKDSQDYFLQSQMEKYDVKRRRPRLKTKSSAETEGNSSTSSVPKRNYHFKHFINYNGKRTFVCKKAFTSIYGITNGRVNRLCDLLVQNRTPKDNRGKHGSHNAVPEDICEMIHSHISSFPTKVPNNECNEKPYLDGSLNIKKMFNMFLDKHPECEGKVSYHFYWVYFRENFDLKFGPSQKDVCVECGRLESKLKDNTLNDDEKNILTAELFVHKTYVCTSQSVENLST